MEWLLKILVTHKRLRGLSESQLQDLIHSANDVGALRIIKNHLEQGDFRYSHIEAKAPAMIQECIDRAKELLWEQNAGEIKQQFIERLGDPLALLDKVQHWFL